MYTHVLHRPGRGARGPVHALYSGEQWGVTRNPYDTPKFEKEVEIVDNRALDNQGTPCLMPTESDSGVLCGSHIINS